MTFDKATYRVSVPDDRNASVYESCAYAAGTAHVTIETNVLTEENEIEITVHGDAYVIPLYEQELRTLLPDSAVVSCDVDIGGGDSE